MLSTYVAGTRHHDETLVRCLLALLLCIPFRRCSGEVHSWVCAIRVDVIVSCVFAHLGSQTGEGGQDGDLAGDLNNISTQMIIS